MKILITTFLIFTTYIILAQSTLTGTVVDDSQTTVNGANIFLSKGSDNIIARTSSDTHGSYSFKGLSHGTYKLKVSQSSFETYEVNVKIAQDTVKHKITLKALKLEEVVIDNMPVRKSTVILSVSHGYSAVGGVPASYGNTNFNTESYDHIESNNYKSVSKEPLSTLSIDVDRASYSNVRRFINDGELPPSDAVRIEEMINYFSYSYPAPRGEHPLNVSTTYTSCPWNTGHNLLHVGMQSVTLDMDEAPANNLVFLLDVSGSMGSANKLPLLKKGLRLLINEMRAEDRISIVVYAGAAGEVLPPTSGEHKEEILAALNKLESGGSTAGGEGIKLAYKLAKESFIQEGNNRIILATDGDFNIGASSDGAMLELIESKRDDGIFLSVLGFGSGNYKDSKMEKLSNKGNGNYAYIDNILEAKKVLVNEMGGTLVTVAKDVKFQLEFNPQFVKEYRLIGYENRLLEAEDFNDDTKDAGELGAGHTVTAIYEIIPATSNESNSKIDALKYQTEHTSVGNENELLTVKVRYKKPNGDKSTKLEYLVVPRLINYKEANNDVRFAYSVAAFGMILRNSEFKGDTGYEQIIDMAKNSKGEDTNGYRASFIQMVEMAELLN